MREIKISYTLDINGNNDKFIVNSVEESLLEIENISEDEALLSMIDRSKSKNKYFEIFGSLFGFVPWRYLRGKEYIHMLKNLYEFSEKSEERDISIFDENIGVGYTMGYVISKGMIEDFIGKMKK